MMCLLFAFSDVFAFVRLAQVKMFDLFEVDLGIIYAGFCLQIARK